jgi:hypothetical protein
VQVLAMSLKESIAQERASRTPGEIVSKVADLLERSGIDIEDVGRIHKVELGEYQAITKDDKGVAHTHDLERASLVLTPKWADGPAWPVVQPAPQAVIRGRKPPRRSPALIRKWGTGILLPDPQIGFRLIDEVLDPFHDDGAMDVALQVAAAHEHECGVDKMINLGDYLDLATMSRFIQEAAFAQTMQPAVDRGYRFMAEQRATAPNADLVLIEGNHDRRLQNFITTNALAAFGLKQAQRPKSWPVLSLPHLLRLDEMDVTYIDAWPAGEYWVNQNLRCIHGNKVRSSGSTANAVVKDNPAISTVMGHIHRIETHYKTIGTRNGPLRTAAISPGCLCRVDGAVPSVNGSTGLDGQPAVHWEDWQQGVGVVKYTDDRFFVTVHQIVDGATVVGGQEFKAFAA